LIAAALTATMYTNAFAQESKSDSTSTTASTTTTPATSTVSATTADKVTFNSFLESSGILKTLPGEYTFFAPSDASLAKSFPAGVDTTEAGKAKLTALLSNHIVKGKLTSKDLAKAISVGKGLSKLTTLSGEKITVKINESKNLEVADANGNTALAIGFDKPNEKGIMHQIDKPLSSN
jgi:uncharacterized surface protein with fasciclin (FAS1) repeats